MPSVGDRLRDARESQGRLIDDLAVETRIPAKYLEAIEAGDLKKLPGSFFARSFVRQYASALAISMDDLDVDLERWLKETVPPEIPDLKPRTIDASIPPVTHVVEGGRPPRRRVLGTAAALVLVIGVCSVFYSVWLRPEGKLFSTRVTQESSAPAKPTQPPRPPQESTATEPEPAGTPAVAETEAAGAAEAQTPAPNSPGGPLWFEIAAREETWVRVRSDEETLFVGILQPGETRRFSGLEAATMRVGNAGGLDLSVNGRPSGAVGPRGHIRVVNLTPERTDIAPPPRTSPSPGAVDGNPSDESGNGE